MKGVYYAENVQTKKIYSYYTFYDGCGIFDFPLAWTPQGSRQKSVIICLKIIFGNV